MAKETDTSTEKKPFSFIPRVQFRWRRKGILRMVIDKDPFSIVPLIYGAGSSGRESAKISLPDCSFSDGAGKSYFDLKLRGRRFKSCPAPHHKIKGGHKDGEN